ncbi:hypothetical protein ACFOKI_04200 [Sphingomonas qilianensis]|uniref:Uncharacterized protein n=1 Tax=Sphingomonas qilianensis TaxID=1736690 RepID=A0ABU9XU70_9SPHN
MPLTVTDLAVAIAILAGLPIAAVVLNRWKPRMGWLFLGAIIVFVVLGNVIEQAMA